MTKMIGKKIKTEVPDIIVESVENANQFLGNSKDITTAVLLKMEGDAPGLMMLLFPSDDTIKLLGYLNSFKI